ncbi:protein LonB [Desulfobacteraceae bacterium SEEP-SAG9]|nr:protein LonB [Desulfobacteraceae bacterium SEEP-SAG9]
MTENFILEPCDLRCICDAKIFNFKDTSEVEPLDVVIGQERAVKAIDFGLNMKSPGYNIFVTGIEGTGKSTIVRDIISKHAETLSTPDDWCMVNNFKDEYVPKAIAVPPGKANHLSKMMNNVVEDLKREIPKAFGEESYLQRQTEIKNKYSEQSREIFKEVEKFATERNLQINRTSTGYQPVPVLDGKPLTPEEFRKLPEEKQAEIDANIRSIREKTDSVVREISKINQEMQKDLEKLMEEIALFVAWDRLQVIKEEFKDSKDILDYLDEVRADVVENVKDFQAEKEGADQTKGFMFQAPKPSFQKYTVNVLIDQKGVAGAPVIFETNPTYQNVFGQLEKRAYMGTLMTDFTMVKPGSLLKANGGFMIMEIESVLMNPFVWEALKRALQNKQLFIEDMPTSMGFGSASLRPQPIPLEVKVILLGSYYPFQILQNYDSKFNKIFKVRADFDHEVERTEKTLQQYAQFIARACKEEDLLPLTSEGVAAVVEFGEKYASNKNKLSIRFGPIMSILKEADYWARKDNATIVTDAEVIKAFKEYRFRYNLYEEKVHENYVDDTIMIDVDGEVVGQVNALSVFQIGDISFGRPSRITAETYMGKPGVVNIEREAKLSGKTHDKGVMILSGFLGRTFAQRYPLSLSISITFEQSYGGVDGDSASSTELYAIISSLSGIPIKQGIAVTGSVNQKGKIQAIGGVNHKVEGFFDVCQAKGLNGKQGVMIPESNVKNLMLKKEVIDAVEEGKYHLYKVATVEEGIEILTGVPAGHRDEEGNYPEGTVFGAVQKKLKEYLEQSQKLKKEFEEKEEENADR